jgi:tRNA (guanine37-N1)-methyltransferase
MRFDVITLFPELFAPFLVSGVTRRAYESGLVEVKLWNPRDFADGNYRRVDDRPFGGGPGMVMLAEPLALCLEKIKADRLESADAPVILFSPVGQTLNHAVVEGWSASEGAVLTSASSRLTSITRLVWATLCCQAAKLRPWRRSMPLRACSLGY